MQPQTVINTMIMKQVLRILLICASILCAGSAKADGASDKVKGLPVLEVSFSGKSMPEKYVKGTMKLSYTDGTCVELSAKFKSRGATAKEYSMKPSFNMKLRDENGAELDSTLCGLRSQSSWILDAMAIDRIGMRNRVCFDIWNDYSKLPYETKFDSRNGTVGEFVEVYINGAYKGIYCLTDRVNRKLLDLKKTEVNDTTGEYRIRGVLYKHGTNDIGDQSKRCFSEDSCAYVIGYHDAWELGEPEDYAGAAAWAPLDTVYMFKNDYEWVKEHFYLQQLAEYQTFIMAMSIEDNWGNKNSYISARNVTADGNKHRFVYTPWDLDTSLGGHYKGNYYDGNYSDWKPANITGSSTMPVPFSTCNHQSDYRTLLKEAWITGARGALSLESLKNKMYKYRDLFINTGAWERETSYWKTQKYQPPYVDDLAREVDLILEWYKKRVAEINAYFNIDPLNGINGVDEVSEGADNDAYYNIMGMRIKDINSRGIYIHNGKKYLGGQ